MPLYFFTKDPASKSKYDSMLVGFPGGTDVAQATVYVNQYFEGKYLHQKLNPNVNPPRALCLQNAPEEKPKTDAAPATALHEDDNQFGSDDGITAVGG